MVGLQEFRRPKVVHSDEEVEITFQGFAGTFLLAFAMSTFVFQISSLVVEKELKLL